MRIRVTLLLAVVSGFAFSQSLFDPAQLQRIAKSERPGHMAIAKSGGEPSGGYDMRYHRLELDLDPNVRAISGVAPRC